MSSLDAELFIEVGHTVGVDVRGLTLKDQAGLVLARWEAKKDQAGLRCGWVTSWAGRGPPFSVDTTARYETSGIKVAVGS